MNKKILVLIKIYKGDLNPFDECALECALSLKNADVSVLAMSPLSFKPVLEKLTRLGVNSYLVSDIKYAQSDTISTSYILSNAIKLINPDVVFAGRQSVDGNTAQVPLMLSKLLDFELINKVVDFDFDSEEMLLRDGQHALIKSKQIITFEKFKLLRSPSIFSKTKEVNIISNEILKLDDGKIGQLGSPTQVIKTYQNEKERRFAKFISYETLDNIVDISLKKDRSYCYEKINKAPCIFYIGDIKEIAKKYGEIIIELKVDALSLSQVIDLISKERPQIILWEENDKYKLLASQVAIETGNGLCADCSSFNYLNGKFIMTRPTLGGDLLADIISTSPISMATVRKISSSNEVAITVGKGAIKYLDNIKRFAKKYDAKIYCTRPVADENLMPYKYQVGLTGINIAPKVCICIGVSGMIQHVIGIDKANTIIAINNDKRAKIFDYADFGIVMDAKDV